MRSILLTLKDHEIGSSVEALDYVTAAILLEVRYQQANQRDPNDED
jgi:hypothetical protein